MSSHPRLSPEPAEIAEVTKTAAPYQPFSFRESLNTIDRTKLHEWSTVVLIGSYLSSFLVSSAASPLPTFLNGLTSPVIHRMGYNLGAGMQATANLSQSRNDFDYPTAAVAKDISDMFATGSIASAGMMMAGTAGLLLRKPPETLSRMAQAVGRTRVGQTLGGLPPFTQVNAAAGWVQNALSHGTPDKFINYWANSAAGFCTTGTLNAASAVFTICGAKLESDANRQMIVQQVQQLNPNVSKAQAEEIFDQTVPHMHVREAGLRTLGAMLSGAGGIASGLSSRHPAQFGHIEALSGFLFAAGLMASSYPVGNLPHEKRFNQETNDRYIQLNEVTKATIVTMGVALSAGFLWMLQGRTPPPYFKWISGKLDNTAQLTAMLIAMSYGFSPTQATPAGARSLYGTNPRLSQQRETLRDLHQYLTQNTLTEQDEGYATRLIQRVIPSKPELPEPAPAIVPPPPPTPVRRQSYAQALIAKMLATPA